MKRSLIVLGALMISSVMFAQKKENHHRGGEARLEKLKSELILNDVQYASIKDINKRYRSQITKVKNDSVVSNRERHVAVNSLRVQREKEIDAVLTAEQKTSYEKLKKDHRDKRKAAMKLRAEDRQAKMVKELSLTNEQSVKVKEANKNFFEKARALRQGSEEKSSNKEELKKLRQEHNATLQSILTPEQFAKWKELRKHAKRK